MKHRKAHRPVRAIPAWRNPVAAAVAKQRMASALLDERIGVMQLEPGEDATNALAHIAWIVATGCETALEVHGAGDARMRRLHGALRAIEAMCLQHAYRWAPEAALPIEHALAEAHALITTHPAHAARHTSAGDAIAHVITHHQLTPGMVAGAEIYRASALESTT